MIQELTSNPLFGLILAIGMYLLAHSLFQRYPYPVLNPLIVSTFLIILFLLITGISYDHFYVGGSVLNMLIGPATVALGIPLYHTFHLLKKHYKSILVGIFLGTLVCTFLTGILAVVFHLNEKLIASLMPKSITSAIAIEVSEKMGGIPSLTLVIVIVSGIMGAMMAPAVFKWFAITDDIAQGIALGSAAHAVGTSKAIELGATQGAMAGLAIGVTGAITVFVAPIMFSIIQFFFL